MQKREFERDSPIVTEQRAIWLGLSSSIIRPVRLMASQIWTSTPIASALTPRLMRRNSDGRPCNSGTSSETLHISRAAFHARLAKRLAALGYDIERKGRNWDIGGVSAETKAKFSRRTQVIEEAAEEDGVLRPEDKEKLATKTREVKQSNLSMDELREIWLSRLDDGERRMISKLGQNQVSSPKPEVTDQAVADARKHCFERNSVVPTRKLATEALQRGLGQVDVTSTLQEIEHSDLIEREWRGRRMVTSPDVVAEEESIITFARKDKGKFEPLNDHWTIQRDWLNREQRYAVQHILGSRDRVTMLKGRRWNRQDKFDDRSLRRN